MTRSCLFFISIMFNSPVGCMTHVQAYCTPPRVAMYAAREDDLHEDRDMKITTSHDAREYIESEEKKHGKQCVVVIAESQYRS